MTRFWVALAAILIVGVVGTAFVNSTSPRAGGTGATASPATPGATARASASMSAAATPTLGPTAGGPAVCGPATLNARIISWDGAAGHRIATVELRNTGAATCITRLVDRPQLVGGDGTVLIEGVTPVSSPDVLTLSANGKVTTAVQAGNYCGPPPIAPVTLAFVLSTGAGRVLATPLTPTDVSGVPPCNGEPGSAGSVEMQPWTP
ncbi:MAG: DUF4232 domain-containing protein [Chloroflexi bacterium]|nr:DUF4232 domain-containing protein [Chloroflexota bacterium]